MAEQAKGTAVGLTQLVQDTVEFESREMLKRLNVMTREDVKILSARLETLSRKLDEYAERRQAERDRDRLSGRRGGDDCDP